MVHFWTDPQTGLTEAFCLDCPAYGLAHTGRCDECGGRLLPHSDRLLCCSVCGGFYSLDVEGESCPA